MKEIKLYFTNEEMIKFLAYLGYKAYDKPRVEFTGGHNNDKHFSIIQELYVRDLQGNEKELETAFTQELKHKLLNPFPF